MRKLSIILVFIFLLVGCSNSNEPLSDNTVQSGEINDSEVEPPQELENNELSANMNLDEPNSEANPYSIVGINVSEGSFIMENVLAGVNI